MGILPPNPGIFPKPFCKPFPLPLAWRPDVQSNQQTSHIQSSHLLPKPTAVASCDSCAMKHFGLILQHFFRWISFQKESLSLLFGYHGCLRLETPRLYKLKPTALKREKSRSAHALLQWLKKPWFEIFWQTPSSGFLRINSGIGFWKHHPGRKSRSGAWKHHFHLKWSKCITTETRFVMQFVRLFPYTFSTLKSLYPCHGHEHQLEDQHLRGMVPIQWWHSTPQKKTHRKGDKQNSPCLGMHCIQPLPVELVYLRFLFFMFHKKKSGGTTASQRKIELLTRRLTFNFC